MQHKVVERNPNIQNISVDANWLNTGLVKAKRFLLFNFKNLCAYLWETEQSNDTEIECKQMEKYIRQILYNYHTK